MRLLGSSLLLAGALVVGGCGGDDEAQPPGHGGAAGSAGAGGSGGAAGSGGEAGQAGTAGTAAADTEPPSFDGIQSATGEGERISVSWNAASDDHSPAERIAYRVYATSAATGLDWSDPVAVSPAGATELVLTTLAPGLSYTLGVRAVDEAGNSDDNDRTAQATSADVTPPAFAGVSGATALGAKKLRVAWPDARDNVDPPAKITYLVYVADSASGPWTDPVLTRTGGNSATVVDDGVDPPEVKPESEQWVLVRARDVANNTDANQVTVRTVTPEGTPPTFAGAASAASLGAGIEVTWVAATDNDTPAEEIVYNVYRAASSGQQDFLQPIATSPPAATSFLDTTVQAGTTYYYVVRAVDALGNEDENVQEVSATAVDADTTPPVFAGAVAVDGETPTTLRPRWDPATDDQTPAADIVYDVYVSAASGGHDFGAPPQYVSVPGATSLVIANLAPQTTRYVVVRARDLAGNRDANGVQKSGLTPANPTSDVTPPTLGGALSVARVNSDPDLLLASWLAGSDDTYAAADLRYHLCAEQVAASCTGVAFFDHIRATTGWGGTNAIISGLTARTDYAVVVRAEDRSGNVSTDELTDMGTTATSFALNVMPALQARCGACHAGWSHAALVNVASSFAPGGVDAGATLLDLVEPGRSQDSYLYRKIRPDGDTTAPFSAGAPNDYAGELMPSDGTAPLDTATDQTIRDWIDQGAFDD